MKKRLYYIVLGFFFLFLFTLFSWNIKRGAFRNADFAFTVKLQEAIDKSPRLRLSRLVGEAMEGSTFFASPEVSIVGVLIITGLAFYDVRKKKIRWTALVIPLLFFFLVMGEVYGKSVVHHPAPPFFMIKNPTSIFPKYYINEEFSYPSGHAARAIFVAMLIYMVAMKQFNNVAMRKRGLLLVGVLGLYVGLVSISRIYLGHHWLSDIIGGGLVGGGLAIIAVGML